MGPTKHQLINNINLPPQLFPGAADKKKNQRMNVSQPHSVYESTGRWNKGEKGDAVNSDESALRIAMVGTHDLDKTTLSAGKNGMVQIQTRSRSNHVNIGKLLNISVPQFCHL